MKIVNHLIVAETVEKFKFEKSPNYSGVVNPLYLIIHFTAGTTADGAISWFKKSDSKASSHLIIDRDGSIVQMVPFNRKAWHAGESSWGNLNGINQHSIGIELVNAGKLQRTGDGQWVNWSKRAVPPSEVTVARHKNEITEAGWHEYTEAQIEAVIKVSKLLHSKYKFTDILGHDDISPTRKVDPGPLFPMNSFRKIVLGRV